MLNVGMKGSSSGLTIADVTQNPRYLIRRRGQEAALRCSPEKGHNNVFWYQQLPEEGLKFMVHLQKENVIDDSGMPRKRYSAEFPREGPSTLKMEPADLGDSAVYICASSTSTSVQTHVTARHKHLPGVNFCFSLNKQSKKKL
ncbi:hypothetical protein GHT09_000230 [Marmota monax]|uniref:Ig-like domain-containing protein n=1 Tax=Marmota monax TaxID=9995 RepID=A0A834V8D6_MARMO|nr:hypothetical protein GHT09_000230 [Marmota monax]